MIIEILLRNYFVYSFQRYCPYMFFADNSHIELSSKVKPANLLVHYKISQIIYNISA